MNRYERRFRRAYASAVACSSILAASGLLFAQANTRSTVAGNTPASSTQLPNPTQVAAGAERTLSLAGESLGVPDWLISMFGRACNFLERVDDVGTVRGLCRLGRTLLRWASLIMTLRWSEPREIAQAQFTFEGGSGFGHRLRV